MENQNKELEVFNSKLVVLKETTDIKSLLKANEGNYIAYENDEYLKRKLEKIAYIHKKFIDGIDKKKPLTDEQKKGLEKISKYNRTTRYAIQNIRDHNISVITKKQKEKKELQNGFIAVIEPNELSADALLTADELRAETAEKERKDAIQLIIDKVEGELQKVIEETTTYEITDAKIEEFTKIADTAKETEDFQDMLPDFNTMVLEKTNEFDKVIQDLTGAYELTQSNKKLDAANLKAIRMEELFDYNFKYKGEKSLGEMSDAEYLEILKPHRFAARKTELEEIGFIYYDCEEHIFIYAEYEEKIRGEEVENMTAEEWKTEIDSIKDFIETSKAKAVQAEAEEVKEEVVVASEEIADSKPELQAVSNEITASNSVGVAPGTPSGEIPKETHKTLKFADIPADIQSVAKYVMQKYSAFQENRGEKPLHPEHIQNFVDTLKDE